MGAQGMSKENGAMEPSGWQIGLGVFCVDFLSDYWACLSRLVYRGLFIEAQLSWIARHQRFITFFKQKIDTAAGV
ncbi:MAG: hypothetical protein RL497_2319 [Pseudomonadota bacterium]